jgi:hypothetical protein
MDKIALTKKIKIRKKKIWELARGHEEHRSGSGVHDCRPRRLKTRSNIVREALAEYN